MGTDDDDDDDDAAAADDDDADLKHLYLCELLKSSAE
jgi:hypothetical protein